MRQYYTFHERRYHNSVIVTDVHSNIFNCHYLYDPGVIYGPKTSWTLVSHGKGQIMRPM